MAPWFVWIWDILLGFILASIFIGLQRNRSAWLRTQQQIGRSTIHAWVVFLALALIGWSVLLLIVLTYKSVQEPFAEVHFLVAFATFLAGIVTAWTNSRRRAS
jgi:uncharacterized membrane protein